MRELLYWTMVSKWEVRLELEGYIELVIGAEEDEDFNVNNEERTDQ